MNWIEKIADGVLDMFSVVKPPLNPIPTVIAIGAFPLRKGISPLQITSNVIKRLPEAGIETGVNADGSENKINKFVRIIVEETVDEIQKNSRVDIVVPPATISFIGLGGNAGGPVTVTGMNDKPVTAYGILR